MTEQKNNIDANDIFFRFEFSESVLQIVAKALEGWDYIRNNYDLIEDTIFKVVNKVIRKQNQIHARVEYKRPWADCEYRVVKFEYIGDKFKVKISQNRDVITGEVPIEQIEIAKELVLGAANQEAFNSYFNEYEINLKNAYELKKKNAEQIANEMLKFDFEKAKEFYFTYKDRFEESTPEKILSFEEWEKLQYSANVNKDTQQDFEASNGLFLADELEKGKRSAYEAYVQHITKGAK